MKTNEEIKNAYKEFFEDYLLNGDIAMRERLVNRWTWIEKNGFEKEIKLFADELGAEYLLETIIREALNIIEKPKHKMAERHAEYCENMGIRYNATTRQYEQI